MAFRFIGIIAALFFAIAPRAFAETSPKAEIEKTIDTIISIVQASPGDDKKAARRTKLREVIN